MQRTALKTILLGLSLLLPAGVISARVVDLGFSASLFVYLGLFGFLALCQFGVAWIRHAIVRWPLALLLGGSSGGAFAFEATLGDPLTYDSFITMLHSVNSLSDAVSQFGGQLLLPVFAACAATLGIGLAPSKAHAVPQSIAIASPFAAIILLSAMFFLRGGEGGGGLPGAFITPALGSVYAIDGAINQPEPRQPVRISRQGPAVARDIVLIVDESISANYLDINLPEGVRSGLGEKRPGFTIHNFGFASSITHCSAGTNFTLRHGGTREDYRRINASQPAIWAYAKRAGMETVYIDAQGKRGALQNHMDEAEVAQIDRFIQPYAIPIVDRDHFAAKTLTNLLNDNVAQFIYVNKMGAHFPITDKYPASAMRYRPAEKQGRYLGIGELRSRDALDRSAAEWRHYRNTYRNTVEWNVGRFFDIVFTAAKPHAATIFYTSDHGQDLHERGNPGSATHCEPEPMMEEGIVPLVVIESGDPTRNWANAVTTGYNARTHFRIFPTLISLMGYDQLAVRRAYGKTLYDPGRDVLEFNARFNARLGADPVWKKIDLTKLSRPPTSDLDRVDGE